MRQITQASFCFGRGHVAEKLVRYDYILEAQAVRQIWIPGIRYLPLNALRNPRLYSDLILFNVK